jgi:hypothetical protein
LSSRRYIQLYRRKLELLRQGSYNLSPLSRDEVASLQHLEAALPVDTILLCRNMAETAVDGAAGGWEGGGGGGRVVSAGEWAG